MQKIKRIGVLALALTVLLSCSAMSAQAKGSAAKPNPSSVATKPSKGIAETLIGFVGNGSGVSGLQTVVNAGGGISVMDTKNAIVYEYSKSMKLLKRLSFKKELPIVGAFTKDQSGNYYVFYSKNVNEGAVDEKNMALAKYSPSGQKIQEYWQQAQALNSFFSSVKLPFAFGTCRIEVSGNMVAVYFGRIMFQAPDGLNHQASYGFILNAATLEPSTGLSVPYVSHSFNQFILPISGGFVFADHGDAYPRCFAFQKVTTDPTKNGSLQSFAFPGAIGDNYTGAEMGALAKTPSGYMFSGTYDRGNSNSSRNLFLLTMNEKFDSVSSPIWITNYKNKNISAISPKAVQIGSNRYLLLWGRYDISSPSPARTYMAIVDGSGKIISKAQEIKGVQLNGSDVLRYDPATKDVYWAVKVGGKIKLFALNPLAALGVPTAAPSKKAVPSSRTVKKNSSITLKAPKNTALYYTTNGKSPTVKSKKVAAGKSKKIRIAKTTTLKAMAVKKGRTPSTVVKRKYTAR